MANIVLYSTHCPRCVVLEKKLKEKNISFEEVNDIFIMEAKGFMSVPKLEVDGVVMDYADAFRYINEQ